MLGENFAVDIVDGDDSICTGSGMSKGVATPACACKTITRALHLVGMPTSLTTIQVTSTATATDTTETFPINVPPNVLISANTGSTPVVQLQGGPGFVLGDACALFGFTVDINGSPAPGITVAGTATGNKTTVAAMTVKGGTASTAAVLVSSGTAELDGNVISSNAGIGLEITGTASATVQGITGQSAQFDGNYTGIQVQGSGQLTINGMNAVFAGGSVHANGNTYAGLYVKQTTADGGPAPLVAVTGLVATTNRGALNGGAGVLVTPASSLVLRSSVLLGNVYGVLVQSGTGDVTNIDLGTDTAKQAGGNTLQDTSTSMTTNTGAGVCMVGVSPVTQTLHAEGNIFDGVNCATSTATLNADNGCANAADFGIQPTATMDLAGCTQ